MKHTIITNVDVKSEEIVTGDYVLLDSELRQVVEFNDKFALLNPKIGVITTSCFSSIFSLMHAVRHYNMERVEQVDEATFRVVGEIK